MNLFAHLIVKPCLLVVLIALVSRLIDCTSNPAINIFNASMGDQFTTYFILWAFAVIITIPARD